LLKKGLGHEKVDNGLTLNDRSGDIELNNIAGLIRIKDRSGDLVSKDLRGDVLIDDLSGEIQSNTTGRAGGMMKAPRRG